MMEENLGRSTWVTVSTEETGDVDGLQLISPSGKEYDLPRHTEGLVFIKIPGIAEVYFNISLFFSYFLRFRH